MKNKGKLLFTLLAVISLSSCSSFIDSTRKIVGVESSHKQKKKVKWVSKAQHDDLLAKYKNISDKYERLKDDKLTSPKGYSQLDELAAPNKNTVNMNKPMPVSPKPVSPKPVSPKDQTVDVFGQGGLASEIAAKAAGSIEPAPMGMEEDASTIDQELNTYKKAVALRERGKAQDALKIFQLLERSPTKQIRVRSRLQIGEIYLTQKQYDLALQVFENMIFKDSFSGKVLDALQGAIVCTENLGLKEKRNKYKSILVDFFGIQG